MGYDGASRVNSMVDYSGGAARSHSFSYAGDGALSTTARAMAPSPPTATTPPGGDTWSYDPADRLVASPFASSYSYDSHG